MKSENNSEYFLNEIYKIRKFALYFALFCLSVFLYLDFQRFSGPLLKEILLIRIGYQFLPIMLLILLSVFLNVSKLRGFTVQTIFATAVIIVGIGHAEILVSAYENNLYFPKVGLVIILYYSGIILALPLIYSFISSSIIIASSIFIYYQAGFPQDQLSATFVFYTIFAACCLLMNLICTKILIRNINLIKEIERKAHVDHLTELFNRNYFFEKSKSVYEKLNHDDKSFALLLLDLDQFKKVNDTMGHQYGDRVLCKVAEILKSFCKKPLDLVARYGGDEFILLLYDTDQKHLIETCEQIIEQVEKAAKYIQQSETSIQLGISIGVAISHSEERFNIKTMINMADWALYEIKNNGKNDYKIADNNTFTTIGTTSEFMTLA